MKEKITEKINNIIEYILSKSVEDITYAEYRILESREKDIRYEEDQKKRAKDMTELMLKTFSTGIPTLPNSQLPEVPIETKKED